MLKFYTLELSHRIAMAPMTRKRATEDSIPRPYMAEYFAQRASTPGTLLTTDGTIIAFRAGGYPHVPGIWNQDQIDGWKPVTAAVHAKKSFIFMQLWALGRAGPREFCEGPSAIPITGADTPRALTEDEIHEYISFFAQAAKNAIEAGFDGVELHGANGYLIDQFLRESSNTRTDAWGGTIEKRAHFGLEVAAAVVAAIGAERTAVRMSPFADWQDMSMEGAAEQFGYYVTELKKLKLAYLHIFEEFEKDKLRFLVEIWDNTSPVLICGEYTAELAYAAVDKEFRDYDVVVVFGFVLLP